jgi:hypothetical protein
VDDSVACLFKGPSSAPPPKGSCRCWPLLGRTTFWASSPRPDEPPLRWRECGRRSWLVGGVSRSRDDLAENEGDVCMGCEVGGGACWCPPAAFRFLGLF